MRIIIQRVTQASVSISGDEIAAINQGLLLLVGIGSNDTEEDLDYAVRKINQMRIFSDTEDKMNLSIQDIQGEVLSVSQFTLFAEVKKGNRPAFTGAAKPDRARQLYQTFNQKLGQIIPLKSGKFGADMSVQLINDGPVTIILDTKN